MIVKKLYDMGLRSEHAYMAAFGSIVASVVSWMVSRRVEDTPNARADRADRWGIFIGEWAPTFFGLGLALSRYEDDPSRGRRASELAGLRRTAEQTADAVRH
ncbi:hypothetical protein LX15_001034 [Streptoalloteichus tenebrarius]|uniref:Uncharacterized protein n=1 Tax=Streptoalloteichus tenebrarius (strain ATCC 17920 / DSM 40477 / JCM 4838 / CBS 697.72 / NBRC 16177 / NCIMB 11028 / NRRL B-12390 / A12253. 1 / ISP 5477) TaxID=1933 RepID=A0ABT1HPA0_STRSD|nr:hypothetical protein [Streptoalloteichus tenebrarius]MCP2257349.1 hypothetical protein [Streptoalloteichus tenebrarius]BFF04260.1 hypothetical protein GCM10020241_59350 [Streptoalloteichus tenebrarius]